MKRWYFSLLLGAIYLLIFHWWRHLDRRAIVVTGLAATLLCVGLFIWADRRKYFLNHWDRLFHAAVVLDILLEGVLLPVHDQYGFYLCALAFAVVLGGYRAWRLCRRRDFDDCVRAIAR
jgi:hypothetical protein